MPLPGAGGTGADVEAGGGWGGGEACAGEEGGGGEGEEDLAAGDGGQWVLRLVGFYFIGVCAS